MTDGRHLLARLHRPGSARQLALLRITVGLHLATVFGSPSVGLLAEVGGHPHPMTATYFPEALELAIAARYEGLCALGLALAVATALGLATRVVLPLLLVVFVATQNHWFRSTLFHDDWLFYTFPLLALSLSRCGDALSVDARVRRRPLARDRRAYRWPVEAVVGWLGFVYVAAGLAKVFPLQKGLAWLGGASVQEFAVEFVRDSPVYWVLGGTPFDYTIVWPFTLASIGTVVVELGAAALWLTDRRRLVVFGALLGMHLGIFAMGIPAFPQMLLGLAIALVPPERFADARGEEADEPASAPDVREGEAPGAAAC